VKFEKLHSKSHVQHFINEFNRRGNPVAIDTETTGLNWRQDKLLSIVIGDENEAYSFDPALAHLLLGINTLTVFQNFKFDYHMLRMAGINLRGQLMRDIMLIDHLDDENQEHGLSAQVRRNFQDSYKDLFWSKYKSMEEAPPEEQLEYECKDAIYTARRYKQLSQRGVPESLIEHVHRLALALWETEHTGIKCDLDYTVKMGAELKADIVETEKQMRQAAQHQCLMIELDQWAKEIDKHYKPGPRAKKWTTIQKPEFNFQSTQQVVQLLYGELKLPAQTKWDRKTREEKPTTEDDALAVIEHKHPLVPMLRGFKKKTKMYGSFIEGVMDKVQGDTLYPSFNVNGTVTGRISHAEPNMAQMPSRGEWVKIRGIFVPPPGRKLITCDYGQLEVVIAAHFSQDKNLLRIINEGASKHDITSEALGIPRGTAKTLNFAMQYQCQPGKVAEIVGCSKKDAELIWNKYWETYAGEKKVIDSCAAEVDRGRPIVNPFGRQRHFPTEFKGPWDRAKAHRQAYSSLIQGTGSDITSTAFYRVSERLAGSGYGRGWFTVHDELLLEADEACVEEARTFTQETMIGIGPEIKLTLPLTVSCSTGLNRWQK
jgi:DNA polymerase I-like protein with 3'-5' exonuclease and polymerase domains